MICPNCKKQIPKNTINCPHCNMKIGTICKKCNSYNLIYNKACIECGEELIKFCPKCKSANFPNATSCRKCGYLFKVKQVKKVKKVKATKPQGEILKAPKDIVIPQRQFVMPVMLSQSIPAEQIENQLNETLTNKNVLPHISQNVATKSDDILAPVKDMLLNPAQAALNEQRKRAEELRKKELEMKKRAAETKKRESLARQKEIALKKREEKQKRKEIIRRRKLALEQQKLLKEEKKNQHLQDQLNVLQEQLSGLKKQLQVLPEQIVAQTQQPIDNISNYNSEVENEDINTSLIEESLHEDKPREISLKERNVLPKNTKRASDGMYQKLSQKPKNAKVSKIKPVYHNPKKLNLSAFAHKADEQRHIKYISELSEHSILEYSPNLFTQQGAKNILVNMLLNTQVNIISLSGKSGLGKSIVLKATINELQENHFVWMFGKATPLTQVTPCGLFQDILLTFFNIPNFCVDTDNLRRESMKFFKQEFPKLTQMEIFDLLNFLYPERPSYYEEIFNNKTKTFNLLTKIFDAITSRMQTVFVLDNFDYIDIMSYELLKEFIDPDTGLSNAKFILTYDSPRSIKNYLYHKRLDDSVYADISLIPFSDSQTDTFIDEYNPLMAGTTQSIRTVIHNQTQGNPTYIEQILNLLIDTNRNFVQFTLPESFEGVVKARLDLLKKENVIAYELLMAAAILGLKFYPVILNQMFKIDDRAFVDLFSTLINLNFITPVNNSAYEFKSTALWKAILSLSQKDKSFVNVNEKLFAILSGLTLSTHASLAIIATNLKQNLSALNIWSDVVKLSATIGDVNIYVMAQKQCLKLVEYLQGINSSLIRNNIYERLGKILSVTKPEKSIEYLPKVIEHARKLDDSLKEFELTAYLTQACQKTGNYYGVIECVDDAVSNVDGEYELEITMIKSRKLEALSKIGNCAETVDLIDTELMPIFERYLDTKRAFTNISIEDLFETWLNTYLVLAETLTLQGDNRCFKIIDTIFEIINKNYITSELFICNLKLIQALANTLAGNIALSDELLSEILKLYKDSVMDNKAVIKWNVVNIINQMLRGNYESVQDELFQIVTFANNVDDKFTKNILKLFLGNVLKQQGKFRQALAIYSEQVSYFAKEKNAMGVLLGWYLISEVSLLTNGPKKSLEFSLKALNIAQSPKIQNFYFITQLNKVIGKAYLEDFDFEKAKLYIETGIGIARQFELKDLLSELYHLYGKYLQSLCREDSELQRDYAQSAYKMFNKSLNLAHKLGNTNLMKTIETDTAELKTFCKEKRIPLR